MQQLRAGFDLGTEQNGRGRRPSKKCASKTQPMEPKFRQALAYPGPVLVDAVVNCQELAMPPRISAEMTKGFTLYMPKAVLSGCGHEIVAATCPGKRWRCRIPTAVIRRRRGGAAGR
jgi:hypothetical protein